MNFCIFAAKSPKMPPAYRCKTGGYLVPSTKIGDGAYDCPDGSDEDYLVNRMDAAKEEEAEAVKETMQEIAGENKENNIVRGEEAGGGGGQQDLGNPAGEVSSTSPSLSGGGGIIPKGSTAGGGGSSSAVTRSSQPPPSCWNIDLSDLPTLVILGKYISLSLQGEL